MDYDFTAIQVEISEGERLVAKYANFDRESLTKEIYGNQTEAFQLPDLRSAINFIESNKNYRRMPEERNRNKNLRELTLKFGIF